MSALHRIALAQAVPEAIDNSFGDREQILELAGLFSAEDIQLYYQIGIRARDELRLATDLCAAFEMLLLRMLLFSPDYSKTVAATEPSPEEESPPGDTDSGEKKKITARPLSPPPATSTAVRSEASGNLEPAVPGRASSALEGSAEAKPRRYSGMKDLEQLDSASWQALLPRLEVSGIIANVLANTEVAAAGNGAVALTLDASQSAMYSEDLLPRIGAAFSDYFGTPIQVSVRVGDVSQETPAQLAQRLRQEQYQRMVEDFEQDENVQELLRRFSGTLARGSVAPLDKK